MGHSGGPSIGRAWLLTDPLLQTGCRSHRPNPKSEARNPKQTRNSNEASENIYRNSHACILDLRPIRSKDGLKVFLGRPDSQRNAPVGAESHALATAALRWSCLLTADLAAFVAGERFQSSKLSFPTRTTPKAE